MHVCVIGAGGIGLQHILGVYDYGVKELTIIDKSEAQLKKVNDTLSNKQGSVVTYSSDLAVRTPIDLCIIATNSDVRLSLLRETILKFAPKNILLEKFLFDMKEHYNLVGQLTKNSPTQFWVNTQKRINPVFEELNLRKMKISEIIIKGKTWGLARNSIHFIDIFQYLTNNCNISDLKLFDVTNFNETQRKGFFDFDGQLEVKNSQQQILRLISSEFDNGLNMLISGKGFSFNFDFYSKVLNANLDGSSFTKPFSDIPVRVSTMKILEQIDIGGAVNLPTLDESIEQHNALIGLFSDVYADLLPNNNRIPVT